VRLFQAVLAFLPAAAFAATCGGHGTRETTFVTTQWLADHLMDKNLVILAIGADRKQFEEAHIPGSVFFDYHDSHEMKSAAGLSTELPPMDVLAKNFGRYGVGNDSRVILYWLKDWWSPTGRVFLTLDAMGLGQQVSILNGGMPAWQSEKRAATGHLAEMRAHLDRARLKPPRERAHSPIGKLFVVFARRQNAFAA